jgi:hypothetical protein
VRFTLLAILVLLAACEEPEPFETRVKIIVDVENDPLADAASISVLLRLADGTVVEDSRNIEGRELRLEGLSPSDIVSLEVEVRDSDNAIVGLGRSHTFELGPGGLQAAIFVGKADAISRVSPSLTRARTFARGVQVPGGPIVVVGGGNNEDETIAPVDFIGWFATEPVTALAGAELPRIGHGVAYVPEGNGDWSGQVAVFGGTFGAGDDTLDGGWENAASSVALIEPSTGSVDEDATPLNFGYMDFRTLTTTEGLFALIGGYNQAGEDDLPYTDHIVLVDPASGEQIDGPAMPGGTNREQHAAVAFEAQGNDYVLVSGGYIQNGGHLTRDLLWSGRQSDAPVILTRTDNPARARHQATDLGTGQVLISGGTTGMTSVFDDGEPVNTAEIFDPGMNGGTFEPLTATLNEARQRHTAARIPGGRVLICGGQGADGAAVRSCEIFSIDTRRFELFESAVSPGGPGMTAIPSPDGRVFFVGGATDVGPTDALHVYTPPRWQDGT